MAPKADSEENVPLHPDSLPSGAGNFNAASLSWKQRSVERLRRMRFRPSARGAFRRMVVAPALCERLSRCLSLALAVSFIIGSIVLHWNPTGSDFAQYWLKAILSFLCGCVNAEKARECIEEWTPFAADVLRTIVTLYGFDLPRLGFGPDDPLIVRAGGTKSTCFPSLLNEGIKPRIGLVTINVAAKVLFALGIVMVFMLCLRTPGRLRLSVRFVQFCIASLLSVYFGLTFIALWLGRSWFVMLLSHATADVENMSNYMTVTDVYRVNNKTNNVALGAIRASKVLVDWQNLSQSVTVNSTGVTFSNYKRGCEMLSALSVQDTLSPQDLVLRDPKSGSEKSEKCFTFPMEFILKEVYYSLVDLMQKNVGSVYSPQESFTVSWARYKRDIEDLNVFLGRRSIDWARGKSTLQPGVHLLEKLSSPIVGILSRSRPSVLCTFQRLFRCRGFHKGDCTDSSGECSANTLRFKDMPLDMMSCSCPVCPDDPDDLAGVEGCFPEMAYRFSAMPGPLLDSFSNMRILYELLGTVAAIMLSCIILLCV